MKGASEGFSKTLQGLGLCLQLFVVVAVVLHFSGCGCGCSVGVVRVVFLARGVAALARGGCFWWVSVCCEPLRVGHLVTSNGGIPPPLSPKSFKAFFGWDPPNLLGDIIACTRMPSETVPEQEPLTPKKRKVQTTPSSSGSSG